MLYLPSDYNFFTYAVEDSLSISKKIISSTSLDSFFSSEELPLKGFNQLIKNVDKCDQVIIEKSIAFKKKWKDYDNVFGYA